MFSCFRKSRGSGHRKGKGGLLGHLWGRLLCFLTHVCSSSTRENQAQEGLDRLFKRLKFDYRKPDFREKVVSYLPTALRKGKDDFVDTFLVLYPAFATTRKVLELITNMVMNGSPNDDFLRDYNMKRDILFFLIHWLEKLPEDFRMAPDRVILKKLVDYLYQHLSLKFFQQRFQMLMSQLEAQDSTKTLEVEKKARGRYLGRLEVVPVLAFTRELCRSLDLEVEFNTIVEY
ncbi:Ral guanine nucleotide dissociation stimulator [Lemmus lemmus]